MYCPLFHLAVMEPIFIPRNILILEYWKLGWPSAWDWQSLELCNLILWGLIVCRSCSTVSVYAMFIVAVHWLVLLLCIQDALQHLRLAVLIKPFSGFPYFFQENSPVQCKLVYLAPLGPKKGCQMLRFLGYSNVIPNVYLSVFSNLMDRPNHFSLHVLFCFFCHTLCNLLIIACVTWCVCNQNN